MNLYHGSPEPLNIGDTLVPGCDCEKGERFEDLYVTTDIGLAIQYAGYDGFVYEVEPIGDIETDFSDEYGNPITYTCNKAKITRVVW